MTDISFPLQESIDALEEQFATMYALVPQLVVRDTDTSGWSVSQHLEHICIVAGGFAVVLLTGRGPRLVPTHPEYRPEVLNEGRIPRGKVKAPPVAQPTGIEDPDALTALLKKTHGRLKKAMSQPPDRSADHPLLGTFSRDEVFRFLVVHNAHHLAIIDDILGS